MIQTQYIYSEFLNSWLDSLQDFEREKDLAYINLYKKYLTIQNNRNNNWRKPVDMLSPDKDYQTVKVASNGATLNTSYYYVNDELAAQKNPDGSKYYFLSDNLGSTSTLTDQNGNVVESTTYLPFGQIQSGGTESKYLYTGQQNDQETNLDYYNARYYDPSIEHFTQPDFELANVYDPQQLNRYAYVRNNPMTVNDPTGHCIEDLCIGEATAIMMAAPVIGGLVTEAVTHPEAVEGAFYTGMSLFQTGRDVYYRDYSAIPEDIAMSFISYTGTRVNAPEEEKTTSTNTNMSQDQIDQVSQQIGQGHAFDKHFLNGEFDNLGIETQDQFISHINDVMSNPSSSRSLSNGRTSYFDTNTGTVVIYDPINGARTGQYGTALIPGNPLNYYNNLK